MKQVHVYLDDKDHKNLQALLAINGDTVSNWIRRQIKKFLKKEGGKN